MMNRRALTSNESKRELVLVPVKLPYHFIEGLDRLVARGVYENRAEAIRDSLDDFINEVTGFLTGDQH